MRAEVFFYHLTRTSLESALPRLLERSGANGWRVVVRGRDQRRLEWLDEKLWQTTDDGFLPHGLSGGPHDALQPVLLTLEQGHATECLMCIDGAAPDPDELDDLQRACVFFDGNDPEALQTARGQWKALTGAGCKAVYWSEESGGWEKKAESGG